jgi:hypothetical protein
MSNLSPVPNVYHYGDCVFIQVGNKVTKVTTEEYGKSLNYLEFTYTPEAASELVSRLNQEPNINEQNQAQIESALKPQPTKPAK